MLGNLKLLPLCVCVFQREMLWGHLIPSRQGKPLAHSVSTGLKKQSQGIPLAKVHTPKDAIEEFVSLLDELGGVGDLKLHPTPPPNPKRNQVVRRHTV